MNGSPTVIIVVVCVVACCIVILAVVFLLLRRRRQAQSADLGMQIASSSDETSSDETWSTSVSHAGATSILDAKEAKALKNWIIDYSTIELGDELARGNFGIVFKGLFRENECVVKEIKTRGDAVEQAREELISEALVCSKLRPHASITQFFGVCIDPEQPLCLVTELVAGGNLHSVLCRRGVEIRDGDILTMGRDLASGLSYLHELRVVHVDLASRNCLVVLGRPLHVKLCDFGLARVLPEGSSSCSVQGVNLALRWMPVEVFTKGLFSPASDMWTWALVMWEILEHGELPYPDLRTNEDVAEFVTRGGRPTVRTLLGTTVGEELSELMFQCWHSDPNQRPKAIDIAKQCRKIGDRVGGSDNERADMVASGIMSPDVRAIYEEPRQTGQKAGSSDSDSVYARCPSPPGGAYGVPGGGYGVPDARLVYSKTPAESGDDSEHLSSRTSSASTSATDSSAISESE
jgi:serine/threonine protein kinase